MPRIAFWLAKPPTFSDVSEVLHVFLRWFLFLCTLTRMSDSESVKKMLRSVLQSSKAGVSVSSLQSEYRSLCGESIPLKKLGYSKLEDYLKSIPSVVRLEYSKGEVSAGFSKMFDHWLTCELTWLYPTVCDIDIFFASALGQLASAQDSETHYKVVCSSSNFL